MKHLYFLQTLCYMLLCAVGFTACSSDADDVIAENGVGYVSLALNADTRFKTTTKAVDESEYKDVNKYTVQVFKSGDENKPVFEGVYGELKDTYKLTVGQYVLKAFMGEEKAVSTDKLYFYGEKGFTITEGKETEVAVTCKPSSARINVVYDKTMDDYFSEYSVKIETEAQKPSSFDWTKETVGPVYFKVNDKEDVKVTVNLTNKENVKAEGTVKTYNLSPANALKITVKPVISNGNLGISITIDETTVDHPVDIIIPGEWV
ncbi:MAG: DUF4493 domain-containing protein [Parabacteroides sp.]|nr:DUF4493 domain-containing protein [Parabacteroides sp.]